MSRFGCAATCMDGRIQAAVRKHIKTHHRVDFVDIVDEPGINKFLAENNTIRFFWIRLILCCLTLQLKKVFGLVILANIRRRIGISVLNHDARVMAIVGHPHCAGNHCDKEDQIKQLVRAKKTVESFGLEVEIILLWICENWKTVEVIDENFSITSVHSYNVAVRP